MLLVNGEPVVIADSAAERADATDEFEVRGETSAAFVLSLSAVDRMLITYNGTTLTVTGTDFHTADGMIVSDSKDGDHFRAIVGGGGVVGVAIGTNTRDSGYVDVRADNNAAQDNPTGDLMRLTASKEAGGNQLEFRGTSGLLLSIDSSGHVVVPNGGSLLVGHTAQVIGPSIVGTAEFQILGTAAGDSGAILGRWSADVNPPSLTLLKSRGATIGSNTIVADGDVAGSIVFAADDGTDFISRVAQIDGRIDGTPGANKTPGRLVLSTTQDGAQSGTEALRINSSQVIIIGSGEGGVVAASGNVLRAPDIATGGAGDVAGADLTIAAGLGTGTGDPGVVIIQTPRAAGAGDNLQSLTTLVTFDQDLMVMNGYVQLLITDTDGDDEGALWYDASEDKLKFRTGAGVETITSS